MQNWLGFVCDTVFEKQHSYNTKDLSKKRNLTDCTENCKQSCLFYENTGLKIC